MVRQIKKRKRKPGSKTLRKIVRIRLTNKTAARMQRALKRVGIPSRIRLFKGKRYLDLRPQTSTRKIIRKNIALRRIRGGRRKKY